MKIITLNQDTKMMIGQSGNLQFLGVFANAFPVDMCFTFREIDYL